MATPPDPHDIDRSSHYISNEEWIRRRAYELYVTRGRQPGKEIEDWLRAEQELKQEENAARLWRLNH
jgi:Protein of unknown function (DUF2934)